MPGPESSASHLWLKNSAFNIRLKTIPPAYKWFALALVLLAFFLLYTAIFLTGVLLSPTLHLEQLLLHRPLTGIDCVFHQWKRFGEVPYSLFFTFILGLGCLWLGYRRRVLPYLLLLMLLCIGSEIVGKQIFPQPVPTSLLSGMGNLGCQQMAPDSPLSLELRLILGMWWEAPPAPAWRTLQTRASANTPFTLDETATDSGYPSGHAIRWMFLGLILSWLIWRHVRKGLLRRLLLVLTLAIAFGGGLLLVYTGSHLATDLLAGYLIGASAACCAIGLLVQNDASRKNKQPKETVPDWQE
ncbi:MAG: phosphatase PAP2 family protein [Ktedonobacteraceae bacterium]